VEPGNRRLIRPPISEMKDPRSPRKEAPPKKATPPDQTNAENFYYLKQMQSKTQMTIVLKDGETLKGVIEWYAKTMMLAIAAILALAIYGFRTTLAGRPLWRDELQREAQG